MHSFPVFGQPEGGYTNLLENARNLIVNTGWDVMEELRMTGVPEAECLAIARELGVTL